MFARFFSLPIAEALFDKGIFMNITLHYIEKGEGFPLIFLHGNGSSSAYFEHQIEYFSKSYRVYAVDTRGHGASPRGTAPFTMQQFSEDLRGFMDSQNIKKAHLLGFSDGGNIAMTFALKYPERIEKLILNGANLRTGGVKLHLQIPIEIGYRMAKLSAEKSPQAKKNFEMLGLMVNEPNLRAEQLKALHMPTLVIVGSNDMIKASHSKEIADALPDARLITLKGGHCIAKKSPNEFNRVVDAFLKGNV